MQQMTPRVRTFIGQQPSPSTGPESSNERYSRGRNWTETLYSSSVQHLSPSSLSPEKSLLWWRHPFYRLRWQQWHTSWLELADTIPANYEKGPTGVLRRLKEVHCDPDVALRLAFLVASQKPATKSELAGDNKRRQRIKRKLEQAWGRLSKAEACGREQEALSKVANDYKGRQRIRDKVGQAQNHIEQAALELERALSEISLIFIKREDIHSLRTLSDTVKPENVASLKRLIYMCSCEIETLLWPRAVELAPGHELFTLVSYFTACSGEPHFSLVTDLLAVAHEESADALDKEVGLKSQSHDAIDLCPDGAENSIITFSSAMDPETARYANAVQGRALAQKNVITFSVAPDARHEFQCPWKKRACPKSST
jgi:hypothetical protein